MKEGLLLPIFLFLGEFRLFLDLRLALKVFILSPKELVLSHSSASVIDFANKIDSITMSITHNKVTSNMH